MNEQIKIEKVTNKMWEEWQRIPPEIKEKFQHKEGWVGEWQYYYSTKKGKISMITLLDYFQKGILHEIYCTEGGLFIDTRRFNTKEEAEKFIEKMLT